jgi:hypothetical protein
MSLNPDRRRLPGFRLISQFNEKTVLQISVFIP